MMNLKRWQEGLSLCMDNVIRLRDDGKLLMEQGSFGHAYFSFYTAIEELGVAFYILINYHHPKPKELKKFIHSKGSHKKKVYLQIFDMFKSKIKELPLPDDHLKELFKTGESLQEYYARILDMHLELFDKRNKGIYFSPNKSSSDWLAPQSMTSRDDIELFEGLNKKIDEMLSAMAFLKRLENMAKNSRKKRED